MRESASVVYDHSQTAWSLLLVCFAAELFGAANVWRVATWLPTSQLLALAGVLALLGLAPVVAMGRLRIQVDSDSIRWKLGFGSKAQQLKLEDIASVSEAEFGWSRGVGRRRISGAWLYRVQGSSAVVLHTASAQVALGTDEPATLIGILEVARSRQRP